MRGKVRHRSRVKSEGRPRYASFIAGSFKNALMASMNSVVKDRCSAGTRTIVRVKQLFRPIGTPSGTGVGSTDFASRGRAILGKRVPEI